jgi:small nuclear ribonucleoprotein G
LNIVLDEAVEEKDNGEKVRLGMVVCFPDLQSLGKQELTRLQVIRGNSVVMLEALERIGGDDRQHHHHR